MAETRLARALRERREKGLEILDLTASNPTHCGFVYEEAGILAALGDREALVYDPDPRGMRRAREAVCGYYAERGARIEPEHVFLTTSTSEAYSWVFRLLCDAGDEVLIAQPSYPLFDFLAQMEDVRLVPYPLVYDHGWQIDLAGLRERVTPRTRAIAVVHPNNPTGHWTRERGQLEELCAALGLALVVDEVFLDYGFSGHEGRSFAAGSSAEGGSSHRDTGQGRAGTRSFATGEHPVLTFVLSGISKIVALPQMKVAWIAAFGPERELREALGRLEVVADTFLSMNAPVQCALPAWLRPTAPTASAAGAPVHHPTAPTASAAGAPVHHPTAPTAGAAGAPVQEQIRMRTQANLQNLDHALLQNRAVERLEVEAGWYAVLRVPALGSDEELAVRLVERGVSVHPGYFFGFAGDGWLVVSLLTPEVEFRRAVERISGMFRTGE